MRSATQKAVALARASGCILSFDPNLRPPLWDDLAQMLRFANAAAYLVTTRRGAIRSMPEPEQVLSLL